MILTTKVNEEKMAEAVHKDYSNATDLADYLVRKGMPFRKAHAVVGKAVAKAIAEHKLLGQLTLEEYKEMCPLFEADLLECLKPENCVAARTSYGGPAPQNNAEQVKLGKRSGGRAEESAGRIEGTDIRKKGCCTLRAAPLYTFRFARRSTGSGLGVNWGSKSVFKKARA